MCLFFFFFLSPEQKSENRQNVPWIGEKTIKEKSGFRLCVLSLFFLSRGKHLKHPTLMMRKEGRKAWCRKVGHFPGRVYLNIYTRLFTQIISSFPSNFFQAASRPILSNPSVVLLSFISCFVVFFNPADPRWLT